MDLRDRIAGRLRGLVAAPLEKGPHKAVTLAIASSKGGVGKTTTAVNLSVGLAKRGVKVLLIDLDPQAHVAASLRSSSDSPKYLSDVLLGRLRDVGEVAWPSPVPNLDLAGSDKGLAETEMILSAKIGKELLLDKALEIAKTHYEAIILDCPPNLGTLTLNALCAADQLLIPSDMSVLAVEGVGDILAAVETLRERLGRSLKVCGIVATRVDRRATKTNSTIVQSFNDLYGNMLLKTQVPQSSAVNKAHLAGRSVFDFAGRSPGAEAYGSLAQEVGEHLGLVDELPPVVANAAASKKSRKRTKR